MSEMDKEDCTENVSLLANEEIREKCGNSRPTPHFTHSFTCAHHVIQMVCSGIQDHLDMQSRSLFIPEHLTSPIPHKYIYQWMNRLYVDLSNLLQTLRLVDLFLQTLRLLD